MRAWVWVVVVVVVVVGGGLAYLMTADVPAPTRHVEQVIPNDRLGR